LSKQSTQISKALKLWTFVCVDIITSGQNVADT